MDAATIAMIVTQSTTFIALIVSLILPYLHGDVPTVDSATQTLIITNSVTFILLVVSEALPFTSGAAHGILQTIVTTLRPPPPTERTPLIVQSQ